MLSPDDPRLSAYADGQLSPAEVARLEEELATSPAALAECERLRALQRALRHVFAAETAEAELPAPAPAAPRARLLHFPGWLRPVLVAACIAIIAGGLIIPSVGKVRETARRSVDSSNLRQIGQACLIYASEHGDRLPVAADVHDFARQLALHGGLNDGTIWLLPADGASVSIHADVSTVLTPARDGLAPSFARSRPGFAVVLAGVTASDPSTTPIAWTRGLRPDGTWAPDSPYRGHGGHIVFLGGNVSYFPNVRGQLHRHDGRGMTSDLREALPPGARVSDEALAPALQSPYP